MPDVRIITHHSCITIHRDADAVARYVLDPTTMPQWSAVLTAVDHPGKDTFQPGGRLTGWLHILGVGMAVEGELVTYDLAGRRAAIVVRPLRGEGLLEHDLDVQDQGGESVLHFRNRLTLPAWVPPDLISDAHIRHLFDQASLFALANIRFILESGTEDALRTFAQAATLHLGEVS